MINLNTIDYSNLEALFSSPDWVDGRRTGRITSSDLQAVLNEAQKRIGGELPKNSSNVQLTKELDRLETMQAEATKQTKELATLDQLMGTQKKDPYVKIQSEYVARQQAVVDQQIKNIISRLSAMRQAQARTKLQEPKFVAKDPTAMPYHMAAKDKAISWTVNEFVARYFTQTGEFSPNSTLSPEAFWDHFVKNAFIAKNDGYSPNIKADAINAVKSAQKRFSSKSGATQHYSHFKYDSQIANNNTLKIALNTLYSADKSHAVIFAPDRKQETLAVSAAKMLELNPGLSKVEMLTPSGSKIFTRSDVYNHIQSKSSSDIRSDISKTVLSYIGSGKEKGYYKPLATQQAFYNILQDSKERVAKDQLVSLALAAVGTGGTTKLEELKKFKVEKLKAYGGYFGDTYDVLKGYTRSDRQTLGEVLQKDDLDRLQREVLKKSTSEYDKYEKQALDKASRLAGGLGIGSQAILDQLAGKSQASRLDTLKGINAFLSESTEDVNAHNKLNGTNLEAGMLWAKKFPKRASFAALLNSSNPKYNQGAVSQLIKNMHDAKFLSDRGLLDESAANPILNLKGYTQERFLKLLATGVSKVKVPYKASAKDVIRPNERFLDILAKHKLGHMDSVFSAISNNITDSASNLLTAKAGKVFTGTKFAKYPSQLLAGRMEVIPSLVAKRKDRLDLEEHSKQYEASNFMANVVSLSDELMLDEHGNTAARHNDAYLDKVLRQEAKSSVISKLRSNSPDTPVDELASDFDIDTLTDKELSRYNKSDFSTIKGQSIKQAFFGKADGEASMYNQLAMKISAGNISFEEHEQLMSIAQALGVADSRSSGTPKGMQKTLMKLAGLEKDYFETEKLAESKQAGVFASKYIRWAATNGYVNNIDESSKAILESQYKQALDLGLIRIIEGTNGKPTVDFSRLTNNKDLGMFIGTKEAMDDVKSTVRDFLSPENDGEFSVDDKRRIAILRDLEETKYPSNYYYQMSKAIKAGRADKSTVIDNLFTKLRLGDDMVEAGVMKGSGYAKLPEMVKVGPKIASDSNEFAKLVMYYKNPRIKELADNYVGSVPLHGKAGHTDQLAMTTHSIVKQLASGELSFPVVDKFGQPLNTKLASIGTELLKGYLTNGSADGFNTAKSKAYHNALVSFTSDVSRLSGNSRDQKLTAISKYNKSTGYELTRDEYISGLKKVLVGGISTEDFIKEGSTQKRSTLVELALTAKALAEEDFGLSDIVTNKSSTGRRAKLSYKDQLGNYSRGLDPSLYTSGLTGRAFDAENDYLYGIDKAAAKSVNSRPKIKDTISRPIVSLDQAVDTDEQYRAKVDKIVSLYSNKAKAKRGLFSWLPSTRMGTLLLANGGKIPGKGTKDEVPALLTKGEVVLDRATSERLGIHTQDDYERFKQAVHVQKFSEGGPVDEEDLKKAMNVLDSLMQVEQPTIAAPKAEEPLKIKPKQSTQASTMDDWISQVSATATMGQDQVDAKIKQLRGMSINDIRNFIASGEYNQYTTAMGSNPLKPFYSLASSENIRGLNVDTPLSNYYALDDATVMHPEEAKLLKSTTKGMFNEKGIQTAIGARTQSEYADMISQLASNSVEELSTMLKDPNQQARIFNALDKSKNKLLTPKAQQEYSKLQSTVIESVVGMSSEDFKTMIAKPGVELGSFNPAVQANLSALAGNDNDYSRFKSLLGSDAKSLDGIMRPTEMTSLSKALNTINNNLDSFNKLFGTTASRISDQAGLDKVVQDIMSNNRSGYDINKRTSTSEELGAARRILGDISKATDSTTKEGFETSNKLNEMNRQMGDSQSIRERSQMRWANFKELTVQNAAFAASYGVIGAPIAAIGAGANFILELDDKLKNLQAITASTTPELEKMTKSVKQVSVETKFSAGEIADAATILGQAGFSAQDIQDSLKGVAELATATGSNIDDATQTLTSALTVWDAPMRDSTKYANEFTAAINKSKLDMNSLSLALQYAGNIAAEGGIPVEDVLTITSLMKDAGIRQGSTVGTGQRLVYSDIISPSAKFTESLAGVGISKGDLKSRFEEEGIIGALKLMKDSGYGFSQASSGMELREKSAYMAIINQLDKAQLFKSGIIGTDAASQANDIQMQSLMNLGKNMINSWGVLLSDTLGTEFKGLSKIMSGLTYNGKNDLDGDGIEDKQPEIGSSIDYYSKANGYDKETTLGAGVGLGLGGIAAGVGGLAAFRGYKAISGSLSAFSKAGIWDKADMLAKGASNTKGAFGSMLGNLRGPGGFIKGSGYAALFLEGLNVLTSDNPEAEAVKALPMLAATLGGMKLGAAMGSPFGPIGAGVGAIGGALAGGIGYGVTAKGTVDSKVDKLFGIQKNYFETVKSFNSSLEAGSSAMRDMYATRLDVQRTRNNPLAIQEGMSGAEVAQVKASLNKYSEELNKTYKAQLVELKASKIKDATGKDFDFTNNAQDNTQLASYMKQFEDSYRGLQQKSVNRMNEAAIKTLGSETEFKLEKGDLKAQTSAVREELENIIATQARIDPNALKTMLKTHTKTFDKYMSKALEARIEKLDEDLDDGLITKEQYNAEVSKARKIAAPSYANVKGSEAETFKANSANTLLTAGLNLTRPQDIKAWAGQLDSLVGVGGITRENVTNQQRSLMHSYSQSVLNENPILSKAIEDLSEFNTKFQEVNKVFKQFFRDARDSIGDQSITMGRGMGRSMLLAASTLGGNWDGLNGIKARAGKAGISGVNESWLATSPDDSEATQYFSFMHKNAKINPAVGLMQGAKEASAIEFKTIMAAQKIADSLGELPLTIQGLTAKFGEDPQMLKAFYSRQDKLEEIGLNRNVDLPALASLSMQDIVKGPIEKLAANINPVMKKSLEFQKAMAVERLEIQHAEMLEANFGGKNVPYEQSEYAYAQSQREKQYKQSLQAQERQVEFQKANLVLNYQRNMEDMAAKFAFQRNELAIGYNNQVAGMSRQYNFNRAMTVLQSGWQKADLMDAQENNLADAARKRRYAIEDLNTGTRYKTEDASKNLERSLTQLALNLSRSTEAIQRAMAFTESMFERSLDKPVNVTLNPEAFMKVAIALNDTSLALEAHKAELALNTGAIQQLVGIQQSKEDLAKEAYKSAYKAVGGEVYKEDGTINEAFTTEYNQYMKNNSEQLLDTVLEQAINRTMSGTGFDVTSALTDASYMANAVVNPGDATTTEGMVAGSGLSTEDIINALLGTASGEVRLTTTQGVVLEAQGDLGAALFDLQTQMLQYQNQITEAGIQYTQAITDAQQNLAYTLEDIGTAFSRGMEAIQTAYLRDLEQAGETFNRQMEQISTNLDRNLTMQTLQYQFQLQEAAIRFRESLEALSRQEAFNREQLAISLQRALEDLANNAEFRLKESAINNEQNEIAISEGFARLVEKANIANEAAVRALEFQMSEAIRKANFDAQILLDVINRGLRQSLANQLPDMAFMVTSFSKAIEKAAVDTEWKLDGLMNSIASGLEKASKDEQIQKQFREVGGKSLNEILTGVTSGMPTTVKTVIDAINEPINTKFKEGLSAVSREMVNAAEKSAQDMSTASTKLQEPVNRMSGVFSSMTEQSRIMITAQSDLTRQVASVGTQASQAMATAAAQINSIKNQIAASSSGTVYRSSGGMIPGYGGGDIVPAMLEPGEFVIRKEAVRALGEEALAKLNSGSSTEFVQADLSKGSLEGTKVVQPNIINAGANLSVGINVHPEMTIKSIQDNIEKIADGVHRVFQEYM